MTTAAEKIAVGAVAAAMFLSFLAAPGRAERPGPGLPVLPPKELPAVAPPSPAKGTPDLAVQIIGNGLGNLDDLYPDNPGLGPSRFRVGGFVFNSGNAPVPRCEIDLFLSADKKISPDDRKLDRFAITTAVPPAAGGRAGSTLIPRKEYGIAGIPAGTYFICGRVDPGRAVAESREDNNDNCGGGPIRIHGPGEAK